MRGWASLTAEAVCLARAIEALRPPEARVVDDPYAPLFLRAPTRAALSGVRLARAAVEVARATPAPDLVALIAARHRWIDDRLLASLASVDQVLVLGAGYDSRAWRFASPIGARPFLEVDHPSTAARKARCAERSGLPPTPAMAVDLAREALPGVLAASPLAAGRPTFVIWEGVTMYLDRPAVVGTLRALAAWVGPGSGIALDLWTPNSGWSAVPERAGRLGLRAIGEPLQLRARPAEIGPLLRDGGWRAVARDTAAAVARRFGDTPPDWLALVHAAPDTGR